MPATRVLVTGGSGFIAGYVILALLDAGHEVRTTVRSLRREGQVRDELAAAGMTRGDALSFAAADLMDDAGWAAAVDGIDTVLHVASPVVMNPRDDDEVIRPAREGSLRVLRAARAGGVRRVVQTSAFHAVGFGHRRDHGPFTEADWSPLDSRGVDAYGKSKILAERAAWDFVAADGAGLELVTILPVAVMGPLLGGAPSGANHIVQAMLTGEMRAIPRMFVPIVDVRDVAAAHAAAVTSAAAAGQRILVSTGEPAVAMSEIARILSDALGPAAGSVPTRTVPDVVIRLAARFRRELGPVANDLNFVKQVSNERLRTVLGITPRPSREAIVAAGRSIAARAA
jgi:nucleoside-diphosphate-sugar epimerase